MAPLRSIKSAGAENGAEAIGLVARIRMLEGDRIGSKVEGGSGKDRICDRSLLDHLVQNHTCHVVVVLLVDFWEVETKDTFNKND